MNLLSGGRDLGCKRKRKRKRRKSLLVVSECWLYPEMLRWMDDR